jgi:glycosyltransferase involved in cell wall biosynthesis
MFPKLSETFIVNEIADLVARGVRVRVLSLKKAAETIRHRVVDTLPLDRMVFYDAGTFRRALACDRPEVIHAHFATEPTRVARAIAEELRLPFTFTAHGYDVYRRPPSDLAARVAAAAAVVTVSEANAAHLVEAHGAAPDRLRVLPCGVDLEHFQPSPASTDRSTILCVARLRPVKNLGALLRACRWLADRAIPFDTVVIGDGPSLGELQAERARLGLDSRVRFLGAQDHTTVRAWWQRATAGVLTSVSEGMPVSLMEAAACGVPAVAPAVGGIPELIDDGVTGFVTPPGNVDAIGAALARVLEDGSLRARMGIAARRRAEARFSAARQVDALLSLWSSIARREAA